jgi:hypothetical protein
MKRVYIAGLVAVFFASCANSVPNNKPKPSEEIYYLSNEGTVCVEKISPNRLKFSYFPLNKICAPSNLYKIDSSSLYVTPAGVEYKVGSYCKYTRFISDIATTDCSDIGYKEKIVPIYGIGKITISWGNVVAGKFTNQVGDVACFSKNKNTIFKNSSFISKYKSFKKMQY